MLVPPLFPRADGLITSRSGRVRVIGPGAPVPIAPLEAAILAPTGELLDSIQATPEEVLGDPWVGANLTRSNIDPSSVRLPEYKPPRFEPRPLPGEAAAAVVVESDAAEADVVEAPEPEVVEPEAEASVAEPEPA